MISINSIENPQYKQLKKIATSGRERRKSGLTIIDGVHLLTAFAQAGNTVEKIFIREDKQDDNEIKHCLNLFGNSPLIVLNKKLFNEISPVETPTGIIATIQIPKPRVRDVQLSVFLEDIQDPGNLGSILRTSAAANVDAIYLSKGCAEAWSPKALRAGMGAQFNISIYENTDLQDASKSIPKIIATELNTKDSLYNCELTGPLAFIFGNEGSGLSQESLSFATHRLSIPMPGNIESLNVAAAVAICLFERVRQASHLETNS